MATTAVASEDAIVPIPYDQLPDGHLFHLIKNAIEPEYDFEHDEWPQVDWTALLQHLQTPKGRLEAQQWVVGVAEVKYLFLHQLLYLNIFSGNDEHEESNEGNSGDHAQLQPEKSEQNMPLALQVVSATIDAYPDAIRTPDSEGNYPLHLVCRLGRLASRGEERWFPSRGQPTNDVFRMILSGYPEAAYIQGANGSTPLNYLCESFHAVGKPTKAIQVLLEVYPDAISIANKNGRLPLHSICMIKGREWNEVELARITQKLLELYPQALELADFVYGYCPLHFACQSLRSASTIKSFVKHVPQSTLFRSKYGSRTPLIISICQSNRAEHYESTRLLLETCPSSAAMEDTVACIQNEGNSIYPTGDALDHICTSYCNAVGVRWHLTEIYDENEMVIYDSDTQNYELYIPANLDFLDGNRLIDRDYDEAFVDATFDMLLEILRVMYGRAEFKALHAACQGLLCRPWNLVVFKELLNRFGDQASEQDSHGNLPLHNLLESCMLGRNKATDRGYAASDQDYQIAVNKSVELLLEANPRAAQTSNEDDRLPIHLAIASNCVSNEIILESFAAPLSLRSRDITNRLYPFASAAVGSSGKLDLTFDLLRKEPSVLMDIISRGVEG